MARFVNKRRLTLFLIKGPENIECFARPLYKLICARAFACVVLGIDKGVLLYRALLARYARHRRGLEAREAMPRLRKHKQKSCHMKQEKMGESQWYDS